MDPNSQTPSAWWEIFVGASGNLVGGFGATLLWWFATLAIDKRREKRQRAQKREAIEAELTKLGAWLRLVQLGDDRANSFLGINSASTLAALLRIGPSLADDQSSFEPQLTELEYAITLVTTTLNHINGMTSGMASAMRGIETELQEQRDVLLRNIQFAASALEQFEKAVLTK
ncbi:MAG: hypothetical protein H7144_15085 [Burkholderiales bacterium]|nr:hypothetical protein [Phycisphaerae bacterium]